MKKNQAATAAEAQEQVIHGYKGFDNNFKCRGKQYEPGGEYEEPDAKACNYGIHFCEHPFDVWNYYPLNQGNRFATIEGSGKLDTHKEDTKVAATKVKIGLEISLKAMIEGAVKFVFSKTKESKETAATTGDRANAATTGEYANAATTGDRANAATTGDRANAATTGYKANAATTGEYANAAVGNKDSIAAALGINSAAKGVKGSWIVIAEWCRDSNYDWHVKEVKSFQVDDEVIKEDTYYQLKDGKPMEVENE